MRVIAEKLAATEMTKYVVLFGMVPKSDYDTDSPHKQKAGYLGRKIILHIDFFPNFFAGGVLIH